MPHENTQDAIQIKLRYSDEELLARIADFRKIYPDEQSLARLVNELYKLGLFTECLTCKSERIEILKEGRLLKCLECSSERWLTSGTFFEGAKKLFPWILDIYFKSNGIFIASSRFHKLVGVAQSTALLISKRISKVISSTYEDDVPEISTSFFLEVYSRRSSETVTKLHPRSEQDAVDREFYESSQSDQENEFAEEATSPFEGVQNDVLNQITVEPKDSETIFESCSSANWGEVAAALALLELSGRIERTTGDSYALVVNTNNNHFRSSIDEEAPKEAQLEIIFVLKTLFHGVSRKHIQYYIAQFWCLISQEKWKDSELLNACAAFRHITEKEITASSTPAFMKIAPQCLQLSAFNFS